MEAIIPIVKFIMPMRYEMNIELIEGYVRSYSNLRRIQNAIDRVLMKKI